MVGEVLKLEVIDSKGNVVSLGGDIVVEMEPLHYSYPDPYDNTPSVYACSKKVFGKLHIRSSVGLMVKIEGVISGDEYTKDDIPLTDKNYIRLKSKAYTWYGIDVDAKEAYEKESIMKALK